MGESNPFQPRERGDWLATSFLSQFGYLPCEWTAGESNPDYLGANQASSHWTSSPLWERSVREWNPVRRLTMDACRRNTYRPFVCFFGSSVTP